METKQTEMGIFNQSPKNEQDALRRQRRRVSFWDQTGPDRNPMKLWRKKKTCIFSMA